MHQYTENPPADPLKQAQSDLSNVCVPARSGIGSDGSKDIMVQNIDSILQRGERLDLLVDKTDTLAGQAYAFRRGARSVRRQQWWKNTRITALTAFVCVVGLPRLVHRLTPAPDLPLHRAVLRRVAHALRKLLVLSSCIEFALLYHGVIYAHLSLAPSLIFSHTTLLPQYSLSFHNTLDDVIQCMAYSNIQC